MKPGAYLGGGPLEVIIRRVLNLVVILVDLAAVNDCYPGNLDVQLYAVSCSGESVSSIPVGKPRCRRAMSCTETATRSVCAKPCSSPMGARLTSHMVDRVREPWRD